MKKTSILFSIFLLCSKPIFAQDIGGASASAVALGLISVLFLILIVFLIIRRLILWYFKIDTRIENQKEIIRQLKKINRVNEESETDD